MNGDRGGERMRQGGRQVCKREQRMPDRCKGGRALQQERVRTRMHRFLKVLQRKVMQVNETLQCVCAAAAAGP